MMKRLVLLLAGVMTLVGCNNRQSKADHAQAENSKATYFALCDHDTTAEGVCYHYQEAVVYNPWEEGKVMCRYYLMKDAQTPTPEDGIRMSVPVTRVATTSCTHVGFLNKLNALETLVGVTNPELVYTPLPGSTQGLGDSMTPDAERFVSCQPEVVFMSAYSGNDAAMNKLEKVGLHVIPVVEWMEEDPLARAEWIRFFGAFVGKETLADSLFEATAGHYAQARELVENSEQKGTRTILSGGSFRGTWYVPSGTTYMGRLFHDAGASYAYQDDQTKGSLPLSLEQVVQTFREADVWVGAPTTTLQELKEMDDKHTWFSAYENGEVYHFNRRTTPSGGNDFWENGTTEPDVILTDLIYVLYPNLLPGYTPKYLERLR